MSGDNTSLRQFVNEVFPQEFQHGHGDVHQQLPLWSFSSLVPKDPYSEQSNVIVIIFSKSTFLLSISYLK